MGMFKNFLKKFESNVLDKLTPEETDELSDKIAKKIIDTKMTVPAEIFLEMMSPISTVGGISIWMGAPFLELFGIKGYSYSKFFMKKENVRNLINKIKEQSLSKK